MKGAIFDMDGTILDSMFIWETAGEDYLRTLGATVEPGLHATIKSMSMTEAADYCIATFGLSVSPAEFMAGMNATIDKRYLHELQLKPGAKDFLHRLRSAGIPLCLATATDRYMAEGALRRCGVLEWFDCFLTCSEVGRGKEFPDIFQEAARRLGTEPAETWVFEDSLYAARTAKAAGFPVAAVYDPTSAQDRAELTALAECYLETYADWRDSL